MAQQSPRARAMYLYADNRQYGSAVVERVYNEFIKTVRQIEHIQGQVQLSYDQDLHAFSLSCPTMLGPVLHESMEAVLAQYRDDVADPLSKEAAAPVEPMHMDASIGATLSLPPVTFPPDNHAEQVEERVSERAFPWDFEGKRVTVEQWIAGMGETVQVPPDTRPQDPPVESESARRMLQSSQRVVGRIRVPAEPVKATLDAENKKPRARSSSSSSAWPSESGKLSVSRLLAPTRTNSDSSDESSAKEVDIASLLGKNKISMTHQSAQSQSSPRPTLDEPRTERSIKGLDGTPAMRRLPGPSRQSSPSVRRSYAKIDSHGLAGRADAQAQWEIETGILPTAGTISRKIAAPAMPTYDHIPHVQQYAWETNVVPNEPVRSERLIDVAVDLTAHDQYPPLVPKRGSKALPKKSIASRMPAAAIQQCLSPTAAQVPDENEEDMIAFSDTTEFFSARSSSPDPEAGPNERLAPADGHHSQQ